jgi:hypothetical protein
MRIRKPTARWFKVPGDPDAAEIKIKALTPGERFRIYDAAFRQDVTYNEDGEPVFTQVTEKDIDREMTAKAAVVDWKHVFDKDGTPMKCNPGTVMKAVNGIEGFFTFVRDCMQRLDDDLAKEKKDQEKNLLPT